MKIALINASPRGKSSTSAVLLEKTKSYIAGSNEFFDIQANKEKLDKLMNERVKNFDTAINAN